MAQRTITRKQTINNVFFITENLCRGESYENAYGCQKDECPDNIGCAHDRFDFTFGDVVYTQKHHDDVDTPTPSPSIVFTQSVLFTQSFDFTRSKKFSNSFVFSKSKDFSK